MIDRGRDWLRMPYWLDPKALVVTHAHDDHVGGLAVGWNKPVYATTLTLPRISRCALEYTHAVVPGEPFTIGSIRFIALAVEHSLHAPAVGLRVSCNGSAFFYVPDVAVLPFVTAALNGVSIYVGDGAAVTRPIIRWRDGHAIGHASIKIQLAWCREAKVRRVLFTHCGTGIVGSDARWINAVVRRLGQKVGVDAQVAHDRMVVRLAGLSATG
jgi:glyoxylase-like metal-dependent hydrolase (beta-lactamase superfamily II)